MLFDNGGEKMIIKVEETEGKRLDSYLCEKLDYSRSRIEKGIMDSDILVNEKKVKKSYQLKEGDVISVNELKEKEMQLIPQNLKLDIIYEDEDVLVVNKPSGMVVHPAVGNPSDTLVNGLLFHSKSLSHINGEFRPGIVHRIDADTSGLLMVAKNDKAHLFLAEQLANKTITRKYIALVWGVIENDSITIDAPIGRDKTNRKKMAVTEKNSKKAITHLKVIERYQEATLVELTLETGRTHQIRVHMNYIGHPIVNDPVYGRRKLIDDTGQCLHAQEIGFVHPRTKEYLHFTSPLPECFIHILNLFKENK